jgi:hypothetical protein
VYAQLSSGDPGRLQKMHGSRVLCRFSSLMSKCPGGACSLQGWRHGTSEEGLLNLHGCLHDCLPLLADTLKAREDISRGGEEQDRFQEFGSGKDLVKLVWKCIVRYEESLRAPLLWAPRSVILGSMLDRPASVSIGSSCAFFGSALISFFPQCRLVLHADVSFDVGKRRMKLRSGQAGSNDEVEAQNMRAGHGWRGDLACESQQGFDMLCLMEMMYAPKSPARHYKI